ncbi:membrane protein [Spirochaetia bacterium]|nr:membrane protein [Spirochaetia bacterium]
MTPVMQEPLQDSLPINGEAMKFRRVLVYFIILIFFSAVTGSLGAETFTFKDNAGDKQRTISTVNEEVLLNGVLLHKARILNRMASEVTSVEGGTAQFSAVFQLAEEQDHGDGDGHFVWSQEYNSVFGREQLGKISIGSEYIQPAVRNLPVFPQKELLEGDTWEAEGYEAHDLAPTFGIKELFRIPFIAKYTFLGERKWKGTNYKTFSIEYSGEVGKKEYLEDGIPGSLGGKKANFSVLPEQVSTKSTQIVYWDTKAGQPAAAHESFSLIFKMNDGNVYEFRGKAEGEILESQKMNKEELAEDIEKDLRENGILDAAVKIVDEGISITLENIQFEPDSAILINSEKQKLEKIGEILKKYPERDILVAGHAALAGGSEKSRLALSEERAYAVSDYMIKNKVRGREHIMTRGYGSQKPVASNNTEEGRIKNRRVEITILEN